MRMDQNPYYQEVRAMAAKARASDERHGRGERWFSPGKRPGKISIAMTVIVLLAVLAVGNYFWARHAGAPVLKFGEETVVQNTGTGQYRETVARSLGFDVHHFYGNSVDYKVIAAWGSEVEQPVILSDSQLEELAGQLAAQYGGEDQPGRKSFAGLHVLHAEPLKTEAEGWQIICLMAVGEYERIGSRIIELDGSQTTAAVIQCQRKEDGLVVTKVWKPSGGDTYGYGINSEVFRQQFPEGKLIFISDDAPTDAQRKRSQAAQAGFTGQ